MATGRIPINATAAIQSTIVDAKGDLIAGTGADAVSRLAVGANGTTLVADSSEATGLKWAAASGGGKVLQVVQGTTTTSTSTTNISPNYVDTTLTATITPTLNTSKVLVLLYQPMFINSISGSAENGMRIKLLRDATDIVSLTGEVFRQIAYKASDSSTIYFQ
jgi:hypothetical protein